MKKLSAFILLFICAQLSAQSPSQYDVPWYLDIYRYKPNRYQVVDLVDHPVDTINFKDPLGRNKGHWQIFMLDSALKVKFIESEGYYALGKKMGLWKFYHPNGKLRGTGYFLADKLVGAYETYFEDGALREKGNWDGSHNVGTQQFYSKGNLTAERIYDNSGKVIERYNYFNNGKLRSKENDSLRVTFNTNGISSSVSHLKNGKLNGFSYEYDENGKLTEKSFYLNSQRHGQLFLYHKNGNIKFYAHYLEGKMFGERIYYDENGEPIEGNFTFYRPDGSKEREGFCKNGKPEGLITLFNSDGTLLMTVQHKDGKPHGKQIYYNEDGSVREEFLYSNGEYMGAGKTNSTK